MIGIGGVGMSALARLFMHDGKQVSGSDKASSAITAALAQEGAVIHEGHHPDAIDDGVDLVVYTEALADDNEALAAARALDIPTVNYFEALGHAVNRYHLIAVAGTHGKTTTTAMLTDILEAAQLDPTAIIGSLRSKTNSNFRAGESKYAVVEACEYRRDFLHLAPNVLVITNIEKEHLDYYRDLADIQDAFTELAARVPEDGYVVCNPSDPNVAPVLTRTRATVIDYTKHVDPRLTLRVPGIHNLMNAAAARAAAETVGVKTDAALRALSEFAGTWRRSEYLGTTGSGALVFDDYAHHPTEIRATLGAFKERYPDRRLVVAFQPHLHSRTHDFFEGFVEALAMADVVLIAPIHEARTETRHTVSSETLASALGERAVALGSYEDIARYLNEHASERDLIITMGAGPIDTAARLLLTEY